MKTVCEKNMCNGCMVCYDSCPLHCIEIRDSVFYYNAVKDDSKCINCGLCEKVCPNINKVSLKNQISYYQGWATKNIRLKSTSGGAATAFINSFIESGGYVASCVFEHGEFIYKITNSKDIAKKFTGSKYVKSNPIGIYKKIKERIKTNKVLFIGLPCQVAALKNYIKDQDKLYTIDLICHGTPSPILLDKSLKDYNVNINEIESIEFRNKNDMGISVEGKRLINRRVTDDYTCAFLTSIDYTENCYYCQFATAERVSDITLGDSWGTDLITEEKKGISLLLIQTNKGEELVKNTELNLYKVDLEKAIRTNHQLEHPSIKHKGRDVFVKNILAGKSFRYAVKKVIPKMIFKQKIKYVFCKLGIL